MRRYVSRNSSAQIVPAMMLFPKPSGAGDEPNEDSENNDDEDEGRGEVGGDVYMGRSAGSTVKRTESGWSDEENLKVSLSSIIATSLKGEGERELEREEPELDESDA